MMPRRAPPAPCATRYARRCFGQAIRSKRCRGRARQNVHQTMLAREYRDRGVSGAAPGVDTMLNAARADATRTLISAEHHRSRHTRSYLFFAMLPCRAYFSLMPLPARHPAAIFMRVFAYKTRSRAPPERAMRRPAITMTADGCRAVRDAGAERDERSRVERAQNASVRHDAVIAAASASR